jgi:hypothetical protein
MRYCQKCKRTFEKNKAYSGHGCFQEHIKCTYCGKEGVKAAIISHMRTHNHPIKICLNCGVNIGYKNKFCSHKCSCKFYGKIRTGILRVRIKNPCVNCGKETFNKYCSYQCQHDYQAKMNNERIELEQKARCKSEAKKYLIRKRGIKCEECGRTKWRGKLIPVTLEHIDGNKKNHHLQNIKLLCWNCHALTPTFGSKNARRKSNVET